MKKVKIVSINYETAKDWFLHKHYAKRVPNIMYKYGCFVDGILHGVITYGVPPNKDLSTGVCGEQWKDKVIELNRLTMLDNHKKNLTSYFVSTTLRLLPKPSIVVSYADTAMNHYGYIYQATNFIYTGVTKERNIYKQHNANTHSRTLGKYTYSQMANNPDKFYLAKRSPKHRYVYFTGTKKQVKKLKKDLNYKLFLYPKGQSQQYDNKKNVAQQMTFL